MKKSIFLMVTVLMFSMLIGASFTEEIDFPDNQEGTLNVQMYDVSRLPWNSNRHKKLWNNRNKIFKYTLGGPVVKTAFEDNNADPTDYDYIFYAPYNQSFGETSKTAQRIWGYFVPKVSGNYKFKTISDDGHYFRLYNYDIYNYVSSYLEFWEYYSDSNFHGNNGWNGYWGNWNNGNGYVWGNWNHWGYWNNWDSINNWTHFYRNGINLANKMIVGANNVSTSEYVNLVAGEAYPVYLEYFNWGGQGKFQLEYKIGNGNFVSVDYSQFYSGVGTIAENFESLVGEKTNNSFKLNWDNVDGASAYKIVYSEIEDDNGTVIGTTTSNSYTINLTNNNNYENKYFKVIALIGNNENISNSIYLRKEVLFNTLAGKFIDSSYILNWEEVPGAEKYKLLYGSSISNINSDILGGESISPEIINFTISNPSSYLSKYIKANVLIDRVYYPSNPILVSDASGSGIDITEENGMMKYHAYDNFNDGLIDNDVWEVIISDDLSESAGTLNGKNIGKIKLKGNYNGFENYKISIDLLKTNQSWNSSYADGGLGTTDENGDSWISRIDEMNRLVRADFYNLDDGDEIDFSSNHKRPNKTYYDYRYVLSAEANGSNPKLDIYNITNDINPVKLATWEIESSDITFDFNEIFIGNGYGGNDLYKMDNFDFIGYKQKGFDTLVGQNIDGDYKLSWEAVTGASGYRIIYGDLPNLLGAFSFTLAANVNEYTITAAQVEALGLKGKTVKVVAVLSGSELKSNGLKFAEDSTFNTLQGSFDKNDGTKYNLKWEGFNGAHNYSVLYGDVDDVNNPVSGAQNISANELAYIFNNINSQSPYYNKLIRVKANKDGIDYYSNQVLLSKFDSLTGEKMDNEYILKWNELLNANSYKVMYGEDEDNITSWLTDISDVGISEYIISTDVIEENDLKGKYFKIVAQFDDLNLDSNAITFNENFEIGSLVGEFSGDSYIVTWNKFDGAENLTLLYGDMDSINNVVQGAEGLSGTSHTIDNLDSNSIYFDKFLRIRALKDGIYYYSNLVKIDSFTSLELKKVGSSYKLVWDKIQGATGYKIIYGPTEAEIETLLTDSLNGSAGEYTITDITGVNSNLVNQHFKVVAIFEGSEIASNSIVLEIVENFDSLEGTYSDTNFNLSWDAPSDIDSLVLLWGEEDNVNSVLPGSASISITDESYVISGISETSPYYGKFVRLMAKKGNLTFYSNSVLLEEIDFTGDVEAHNGEFDGEFLKIKYGTEFEIGYNYAVTDIMHNPYFHFDLQGNDYLTYEKIVSKVYKVVGNKRVLVSSKVIFDQDIDSITLGVNIFPKLDNDRFEIGNYIVLIAGKVVERDGVDLMQYLPENTKNWQMTYLIENLKIDGVNVRTGLYIENFVYWNSTNKVPEGLTLRDKNKKVFHADVEIKDKNVLPKSQ